MNKPIIPDAALAQHVAVLGKTGSGKTFAAKAAIVEPMLEQGRRVGIVDPTGAWWGLRSSRDGKGPGFKVLVLGGDHGDLPLPALGGAAVARLLAEQNVNLIADTSQLTVGERTRWFIDFAGTLYRANRAPLTLVMDEAHVFAPQGKVPDPDTGKMLHAANQLAAGGRSRGIRLVMITQRPQKLHKDTLTSADTLIAMRVLAPHDRSAVEDWIKGCGDMAAGKEVLNSLASLQRGEGWIWYPEGAHLVRAKFPHIRTFDSSATPTDGHATPAPKGSAEIDLIEVRAALADAVREAEANDPKLLRAENARLRAEIAKKPVSAVQNDGLAVAAARQEGREEGARDGYQRGLVAVRPYLDRAKKIEEAVEQLATTVHRLVTDMREYAEKLPSAAVGKVYDKRMTGGIRKAPAAAARTPSVSQAPRERAEGLSGPQQRILDALAWLESVGVDRADRVRAAMLADQSPRSSGFEKNISTLKTAGLIDYPTPGFVILTDSGRGAANEPERPPTVEELRESIRRKVSGPQWAILAALIDRYPEDYTREQVADKANASPVSSGFEKNISTLRSLGFIDYPAPGKVVALPVLFLE